MKPVFKNGKWLIRVCLAGQRVSKTFRIKREAEYWSTQTKAELLSAGQPKGRGPQRKRFTNKRRVRAHAPRT